MAFSPNSWSHILIAYGGRKLSIETFGQDDAKLWNEIVYASPNGTLFHSWEWLKIVEKHSGSKLFPLVFFDADDKKPFGAIPLFFKKKLGMKMVFSPPPGSAITLGPILVDKGYKQHKYELSCLEFQASVDTFINSLGAGYINIVTSPGLLDIRPFSWSHYTVAPCYTYLLNLSPSLQTIWNNSTSSLKRDVNSAQKKGVIIQEPSDEIGDYLFGALEERYAQNHQRTSSSKNYYNDIFNQFRPANIKAFVALYEGKMVTATVCTIYKDTVTAWIGSTKPQVKGLEANKLLYWNMIMWAKNNNYQYFEVEGANTKHLCAFKSIFDPALSIYFEIKKMNLLGSFAEKAYFQLKKKYL